MNEEQIADLLRAANPVPHHRDAIRVVRETDPLWQSIQVLLREEGLAGPVDVQPFERTRQPGSERMSEQHPATTSNANRSRRWVAVAAAAVFLLVVGTVVTTIPRGGQVAGIPSDLELPTSVLTPQDAARILDISEYATINSEAGPGLAPGDCTSLGVVDTVNDAGYLATTSDRGMWGTRLFEFSSARGAAEMIDLIEEDIQDCDRAEHPLFTRDLVSIESAGVGERSMVLTVEDQGERDCWVFVQEGPRIAVTLLTPGYYADGQACGAIAGAWAEVLSNQ